MALKETPICDFGWKAPEFELADVNGRLVRLEDVRGVNGTVVVFMCNHCPYVQAIADRLVSDAKELAAIGVGVVGINSNDADNYPEDSPAKMKEYAAKWGLPFPYLFDADQSVAKAYGAVCTPDFFGFDADLGLQYRGRIDSSPRTPDPNAKRELLEAMRQVAEGEKGPEEQIPSMGCSIKWR